MTTVSYRPTSSPQFTPSQPSAGVAPSTTPTGTSSGDEVVRTETKRSLSDLAAGTRGGPSMPVAPPGQTKAAGKPKGGLWKRIGRAIGGAARSAYQAVENTLTGAWKNIAEGTKRMGRGFARMFRGEFGAGAKDIALGFLDATLGTAADAILVSTGKGVSAIQTLFGIETAGRELAADEVAMLRSVYGDSIDYDKVRIKEGRAGIFGLGKSNFAMGDTIYLINDNPSDGLLVHEMAHVWQHQNGGTDYMREALVSQNWGKGYDWEQSVPTTPWADLEPEQQAEFMEDLFQSGYFDPNSSTHGTFSFNGRNLNAYATSVVAAVRAGEGAP